MNTLTHSNVYMRSALNGARALFSLPPLLNYSRERPINLMGAVNGAHTTESPISLNQTDIPNGRNAWNRLENTGGAGKVRSGRVLYHRLPRRHSDSRPAR